MAQSYFSYSQHQQAIDPKPILDAAIAREFYLADAYLKGRIDRQQTRMICEKVMAGSTPIFKATIQGRITSNARRTWKNIREDNKQFFLLWFPTAGTVKAQQNGRSVTVNPEEFLITYAGKPFKVEILPGENEVHESLQVALPAHLINSYLPNAEQISGRSFSLKRGGALVAKVVCIHLFEEAEKMSDQAANAFIEAALETLGEALQEYGEKYRSTTKIKNVRLAHILEFLDFNLSSPGLTAAKVAAECGISSRYLHLLFRENNMNYHDYVWNKRLELAHGWLSKNENAHESISQVAYKAGFRSISHFSRVFKDTYGYTPSQLKNRRVRALTTTH